MSEKKISQRLEQAIAEWQCWQLPMQKKPVLVSALAGGETNWVYLLDDGTQHWVLRLLNLRTPTASSLDARINEQQAHNAVHALGLSPALAYVDPAFRYQLCEYVHGINWHEHNTNTTHHSPAIKNKPSTIEGGSIDASLQSLIGSIKSIQTIRIELPTIRYAQKLSDYWQRLEPSIVPQQYGQRLGQHRHYMALARRLDASFGLDTTNESVLCHHDLNAHNIIVPIGTTKPSKLQLIDWEFACLGPATMDFAILTVELKIDINDMSHLSGYPAIDLELAADVYRYLCQIYRAVVDNES